MNDLSINTLRQQFPALEQTVNGKPLIYFDNAATTQKPLEVIQCIKQHLETSNANVHRASHALSTRATSAFEFVREQVRAYLNANTVEEIIWTKGTTEAINLVSQCWGQTHLKPGDEIVLSYAEHHANIVPWQMIAEKTGALIRVLPLTSEGRIDISALPEIINENTRIVCCSYISNVIGKVNPVREIIAYAKKYNALTLIDGAQSVAHFPVDVTELDCDFYVFSAHKMYGPTGVGVLYAKKSHLLAMPPYQGGGEMIKQVSFTSTSYGDLPYKFEAGTPNIAGVIALGAAIEFMVSFDTAELQDHETSIINYAMKKLLVINGLEFIVAGNPDIPIFSFTIKGHHNHDIAAALDNEGIAIRSGHHCAMPLMQYLKIDGCIRASLAPYNTLKEIDQFINVLRKIVAAETDQYLQNNNVETSQEAVLTITALTQTFINAKSWDTKHREIMLLGKSFNRMPKDERKDELLILGCESKAWLKVLKGTDQRYYFTGDSDARIIRGLMQIILVAFNGKSAKEIATFNVEEYFFKLGLMQHLSPSRGNGLRAIVKRAVELSQTV